MSTPPKKPPVGSASKKPVYDGIPQELTIKYPKKKGAMPTKVAKGYVYKADTEKPVKAGGVRGMEVIEQWFIDNEGNWYEANEEFKPPVHLRRFYLSSQSSELAELILQPPPISLTLPVITPETLETQPPSAVSEDPGLKAAELEKKQAEILAQKEEEDKLQEEEKKQAEERSEGIYSPPIMKEPASEEEEELISGPIKIAEAPGSKMEGMMQNVIDGVTTVKDLQELLADKKITQVQYEELIPIARARETTPSPPPTPGPADEPPPPQPQPSDPALQPSITPTGGSQAVVGPAVKNKHPPKYHLIPLLLIFGSNDSTIQWDTELEANIFNSKLSAKERISYMELIIVTHGDLMLVTNRLSDTFEELNELMQMKFSIIRLLQRGERSKTAMVPISSLVNFASKIGGSGLQQNPMGDEEIEEANDLVRAQQQTTGEGVEGLTPKIIDVGVNEARKKLSDAYRHKLTDDNYKPIINPSVAAMSTPSRRKFGNVSETLISSKSVKNLKFFKPRT